MVPKSHIILSGIISLFLYFLTPLTFLNSFIIFLSSILIDFDHYIYYIFKKKSFNFFKARKWFFNKRKIWLKLNPSEKRKYKLSILLFHGIEFWVILILLAQLNPIFYFILLGILIHIVIDFIEMIYLKHPLYPKISQIYVFLTNKNKKELLTP